MQSIFFQQTSLDHFQLLAYHAKVIELSTQGNWINHLYCWVGSSPGVANLLCSRAKFGNKNLRGHFSPKNLYTILLDRVLEQTKSKTFNKQHIYCGTTRQKLKMDTLFSNKN